MLKKLINLWKIRNKKGSCENCVWWKSEENCNMPILKVRKFRYCALNELYTSSTFSCDNFKKEKIEPDRNSTSTPEIDLNLDLEIERDKLDEK